MATNSLPPLSPDKGGQCLSLAALQKGDIIVSTTTELPSAIIRKGTSSAISHASLYIGNGRVVEAVTDGVMERSVQQAFSNGSLAVVYRWPDLPESRASLIAGYARKQAGKKYDWTGAAMAGLRHHTTRPLQTPRPSAEMQMAWFAVQVAAEIAAAIPTWNKKFLCSELVIESYRQAGIQLVSVRGSIQSPQQIVEAVADRRLLYVGHLIAAPGYALGE